MSKICGICGSNAAGYLCPRCNLPYCSATCYKNLEKHGECSESFYQEQVMSELKNMSLKDNESRAKIIDILKKEAKKMTEDDDFSLNENQKEKSVSLPKEDDLVNQYLSEILNWKPWWKLDQYLTCSIITEIDSEKENGCFSFNTRLVDNSKSICVIKSNPFLYNEILKKIFIYQICLYTYQLNIDDFKNDEKLDFTFLQEVCSSYLEIDHLIDKLVPKEHEIKQQLEALITILASDQSYFLKPYTNKEFFINLIEELNFVHQRPKIVLAIISHLYDLFSLALKVKKEKAPKNLTNVFHLERKKNHQKIENISTRVSIIKSENKTNKIETTSESKFFHKDFKMFLKKLEFYFKWIEANKQLVFNVNEREKINKYLDQVKEIFKIENSQFIKQKELIDKNLEKIRPKNKLIEEI